MTKIRFVFVLLLFLFFASVKLFSQEWELTKEKDGIKVYTRPSQESNVKSFKGVVDIKADETTVSRLIEDVQNFDRWDEDVSEIRVIDLQAGKMIRYYVVYDVPWPFKDRDLCVEAIISIDPVTGTKQIVAKPIPDMVPYDGDRERIVDYWQQWSITPMENGIIHLVVEGFADPAGDIPAWIVNLAITDTPFNMLKSIKEAIESPTVVK